MDLSALTELRHQGGTNNTPYTCNYSVQSTLHISLWLIYIRRQKRDIFFFLKNNNTLRNSQKKISL